MTVEAHRRQAAMGAIVGSLVATALRRDVTVWDETAAMAIAEAESLLAGRPLAMDLSPAVAIPAAVGLAGGASPLLMNPATVELIELVGQHLAAESVDPPADECSARAWALADKDFVAAVTDAPDDDTATLAGGFVGLRLGLGAVPARLATQLTCPEQRLGRRYLSRLTDRLLGIERKPYHDPRIALGPKEVAPGLWLSNIHTVKRFIADHPDGAVISLCETEGRADQHTHRTQFHLDDTPDRDANPELSFVLDQVLAEIRAYQAEGRPVLVHCRHGASRTGLVLRLWLMETLGLDHEAALMEAQCVWPKTSTWNKRWAKELERRSADSS